MVKKFQYNLNDLEGLVRKGKWNDENNDLLESLYNELRVVAKRVIKSDKFLMIKEYEGEEDLISDFTLDFIIKKKIKSYGEKYMGQWSLLSFIMICAKNFFKDKIKKFNNDCINIPITTDKYDLTSTIKEKPFDRGEVYYWLDYFLDHLEDDKNNKYSAQLKRELLLCDGTRGNSVNDIAKRYDKNPQTLHSKKHKLIDELKNFYRKLGFKVLD